jgi:CMP-N,N'-diacetyllegionaminic acid synthase
MKNMAKLNILALIPAREGSKRVPNKNIKLLNGKPLVSYTIEAAKRSKCLNRIIVSTDSTKIAAISRKCGAEVPFLRPREISGSHSTEMQFFEHALNWLKNNESYEPDLIVLLYPTSPFRKPASIDRAVSIMLGHPKADSLRSIRLCSEHPYKMWTITGDHLKPFVKSKNSNTHTLSYQLFPKVYIQNASIYITKPSTIFKKRSPIGDKVVAFIMDELESIDVNTALDFKFAEMVAKRKIIC